MDEGDEHLSAVHHVDLVALLLLVEERLLDFENQLCTVVDLLCVGYHRGSGLDIVGVVIERAVAGRALNEHLESVVDKLAHSLGRCCYTSFVVHNLFWNTNNHVFKFLVQVR